MNESEKQFSFTRAALSTGGRAKSKFLSVLLVGVCLLTVFVARSQDMAPESLAHKLLSVTIANGLPPFATNGNYRLFTSITGTNFTVLGKAGPLHVGNYSYAILASNCAKALLTDQGGSATAMSLSFNSPTNGAIMLTNSGGFQAGAFTLISYASPEDAQLFLPSVTNNQFQAWLSGQPGLSYSVEISTNLMQWTHWLDVPITNLTAIVTDTTHPGARFFRAQMSGEALAPAAMGNKSLNLTILEGALPLPTHGICQWLSAPSNNAYQITGGPGTTNSLGQYTYTRTDQDSGLIACQDSVLGTVNEQLFFTSPSTGYFYATNSTGFEAGTFTLDDGPVGFLGHVRFDPDTAHSNWLLFPADGSSPRLSVTNAQGWIWTLDFPYDALLTECVITMTPFTNIDASNSMVPVTAGVQLSPDGLQFCDPVTLTVTPPKPLGSHAALLMAENDGSNLYFVQSTNGALSFSARVSHFSSSAVTDPGDAEWQSIYNSLWSQAEADYQYAAKFIDTLASSKETPPPPPDYTYQCDPEAKAIEDDQVNLYAKNLFAWENAVMKKLISSVQQLALLDSSAAPDLSSLGSKLETVKIAKVESLFATYSQDPKKLQAVASVAIAVMREDALLFGRSHQDWMDKIQSWTQRAEDYWLDQVRNYHMYSKANAVFVCAREMALLFNDDPGAAAQALEKIDLALTFHLSLDMTLSMIGDDGSSQMLVLTTRNGDGYVFQPDQGVYPTNKYTLKCDSGTWTSPGELCETLTIEPGYTVALYSWISLDGCKKLPTVTICVPQESSSLRTWVGNPDTPNWIGCVGTDQETEIGSNIASLVYRLANMVQTPSPATGMTFPLPDGQDEPVLETFTIQGTGNPLAEECRVTTTFQLNHTPH